MTRLDWILAVLAGLMGAAGVALAAAVAHIAPGRAADQAALMLILHAATLLSGLAALRAGLLSHRLGRIALAGLALGTLLFSGDLALRALANHALFPMAAPTGGTAMILSWLVLALAALVSGRGRRT